MQYKVFISSVQKEFGKIMKKDIASQMSDFFRNVALIIEQASARFFGNFMGTRHKMLSLALAKRMSGQRDWWEGKC